MRQHRLRVDEVVGLSIVTLAVVEICLRWFGLRDPLSLVIVAVGVRRTRPSACCRYAVSGRPPRDRPMCARRWRSRR